MQHAIELMPRPRIRRAAFRPGEVVISKSSGFRVRVEASEGDYFVGEYIGNRLVPEMPPQFRYRATSWIAANFERESA